MTDTPTPAEAMTLTLAELDEYERIFAAATPVTEDLLSDLAASIAGMQRFTAWCDAHGGPKRVNAELVRLARRALVVEPVVEDCLAYLDESDLCLFCTRHPEKLVNWHAADCPLVVAQLINRSGERTERGK